MAGKGGHLVEAYVTCLPKRVHAFFMHFIVSHVAMKLRSLIMLIAPMTLSLLHVITMITFLCLKRLCIETIIGTHLCTMPRM